MHIKTGVDLVYIDEFAAKLSDPTVSLRLFTSQELATNDPAHLAGIFAAKESFFKATQIDINHWSDLEITHDESGKPYIAYDQNHLPFRILSIDCSISHHNTYAIATVVLLHT